MPDSTDEIMDLQETQRIIRCQTQCGCVQYMPAPPNSVMESFTIPAGFSKTLGLDQQPKQLMRMFGFVGVSEMTGDQGEKVIILNYREGATPTPRPSAIKLVS